MNKASFLLASVATSLLAGVTLAQPPGNRSEFLTMVAAGKTVMYVAAHPDDETIAGPLLAWAAEQTRVVVVCFTKGEGGRNQVGEELDAALGAIRARELAAACAVLGVEHRILGFWNGLPRGSRNQESARRETPEQAIARWQKEGRDPKGELVKVIRQWRPDILISMDDPEQGFTGNREHRAVGILTTAAFQEAADAGKFPEQLNEGLKVWRPQRLYYVVNRQPMNPNVPRLDDKRIAEVIDGNQPSPKRGKTYAEIAAAAWARHESQMGKDVSPAQFVRQTADFIGQTALGLAEEHPREQAPTAPFQGPKRIRPIIVAMVRGDFPSPDRLVKFYKQYLTPNDYVLPILSRQEDFGQQLPGAKIGQSGGLLKNMEAAARRQKGKATWLVYDPEYFPNMPMAPPGLKEEYEDYVNSVKKASEIAHRNGFKFLLTPLYQDIRKYDTQFAPYCDMVNLQIPHFIPDYAAAVQRAVTNIKKANPQAVVTVQLQPLSRTSREKKNTDPKEIIQAWKSVSHLVDGVLVFYYRDPDPIPILKEFYDDVLAMPSVERQEQEKTAVIAPLQAKPISILDALARSERVMYVGAHADDENTIDGLLARASGSGKKLYLVCFTRGEYEHADVGVPMGSKMGEARTQWLRDSAAILGAEAVQLPYTDGPTPVEELDRGEEGAWWKRDATPQDVVTQWRKMIGRDAYEDMIRVIREKQPDLLLTWEKTQGWTGNIEHRVVAWLAERAFNEAANPEVFPQQLREGLRPWQPKWLFWVVRGKGDRLGRASDVFGLNPMETVSIDCPGPGGRTAAEVKASVVMSYKRHTMRTATPEQLKQTERQIANSIKNTPEHVQLALEAASKASPSSPQGASGANAAPPLSATELKPLDSLWFAPAIFLTSKPVTDDAIVTALQPWQQNKVMDVFALRCFPPTFFDAKDSVAHASAISKALGDAVIIATFPVGKDGWETSASQAFAEQMAPHGAHYDGSRAMTQPQWLETLGKAGGGGWAWVLERPAHMPTPDQAAQSVAEFARSANTQKKKVVIWLSVMGLTREALMPVTQRVCSATKDSADYFVWMDLPGETVRNGDSEWRTTINGLLDKVLSLTPKGKTVIQWTHNPRLPTKDPAGTRDYIAACQAKGINRFVLFAHPEILGREPWQEFYRTIPKSGEK